MWMAKKGYRKFDTFDPEVIRHKRYIEKKTLGQVATEVGCSIMSLSRFCKEHGIHNPKLDRKLTLDLTGRRFGFLKVLRPLAKRSHCCCVIWECQCTVEGCGKIVERPSNVLMHSEKANKSCGCYPALSNFRGIGDLSGSYFNTIRHGAISRDLDFSITKEYIWNLFLSQSKRCALTGEELRLMKGYRRKQRLVQTASLDRIDSSKGYVEGNVQWIHKTLQFMKSDLLDREFIDMCRKVVSWDDSHFARTGQPIPEVETD